MQQNYYFGILVFAYKFLVTVALKCTVSTTYDTAGILWTTVGDNCATEENYCLTIHATLNVDNAGAW